MLWEWSAQNQYLLIIMFILFVLLVLQYLCKSIKNSACDVELGMRGTFDYVYVGITFKSIPKNIELDLWK